MSFSEVVEIFHHVVPGVHENIICKDSLVSNHSNMHLIWTWFALWCSNSLHVATIVAMSTTLKFFSFQWITFGGNFCWFSSKIHKVFFLLNLENGLKKLASSVAMIFLRKVVTTIAIKFLGKVVVAVGVAITKKL